ncbi:MAG: helix-hairpin-helix domain-containing protein [Cypionkella sp.]
MNEFVVAHWPALLIGASLLLTLLWWVVVATRRTRVALDRRDTLDEGAAPAARNQALIDAAPAAAPLPPMVPEAVGAAGIAVAAAAEDAQLAAAERGQLTQIKGLGPKLAATLESLGVTSLAQIAAWDEDEIDRIDARLGRFQGRIRRDAWVEQARLLTSGDRRAFEAKFGAQ